MRDLIRFLLCVVISCVIGLSARKALAETVFVTAGMSVNTLAKNSNTSWETIYAANKNVMIPVCYNYVEDGISFQNAWVARGKAGEVIWKNGCKASQRDAWLVAGTTVVVPDAPIVTDGAETVVVKQAPSFERLMTMVEIEKASQLMSAPTPFVLADISKSVPTSADSTIGTIGAFASVFAAMCIIALAIYRSRQLREEREMQQCLNEIKAAYEEELHKLRLENIDLITQCDTHAKKRVETLAILAERERIAQEVVAQHEDKQDENVHVSDLFHRNVASHEARRALCVFLLSKGKKLKAHEGISSLIERALRAAKGPGDVCKHGSDEEVQRKHPESVTQSVLDS